MKVKTFYTCAECSYQTPKWIGRCPECEAWNSFELAKEETNQKIKGISVQSVALAQAEDGEVRIKTGIEEFNRVVGGGVVKGELILLSGEPGIGKSTLTLQLCAAIGQKSLQMLYVSGEESHLQVALRAKRLGINEQNLQFIGENNLENIMASIEEQKPDAVIIDSIQVMSSQAIPSTAGSIQQVRYCTENFMNYAKQHAVPIIIIGHVTKEGSLAGPKVLEHLVDCVLFLEGDRYQNYRLLRSMKNRFGPTNEVGVFEMEEEGLKEVKNASELFLEGRKTDSYGSAITTTIEGTRPFLLEVQALTSTSSFGYPKRAGTGFDIQRLQLLAAVIQKYLKINLSNQDIYVNVVGGFKLNEPAADLAVAVAIISSYLKKSLASNTVFLGEMGLSGELRSITDVKRRIQEAKKIGFKKVILPYTKQKLEDDEIEIIKVKDLEEVMKYQKLFEHSA